MKARGGSQTTIGCNKAVSTPTSSLGAATDARAPVRRPLRSRVASPTRAIDVRTCRWGADIQPSAVLKFTGGHWPMEMRARTDGVLSTVPRRESTDGTSTGTGTPFAPGPLGPPPPPTCWVLVCCHPRGLEGRTVPLAVAAQATLAAAAIAARSAPRPASAHSARARARPCPRHRPRCGPGSPGSARAWGRIPAHAVGPRRRCARTTSGAPYRAGACMVGWGWRGGRNTRRAAGMCARPAPTNGPHQETVEPPHRTPFCRTPPRPLAPPTCCSSAAR